jgi:hypothetical protein
MTTAGGTNNAMQPTATTSSPSATTSGIQSVPTTNAVPEFLYQLTKMLTDNNREIIEWSNGKFINVVYAIIHFYSKLLFLNGCLTLHFSPSERTYRSN